MKKHWDGLYYPTKEFQKQANLRDKNIYKQAAKDPVAFWADLAKKELLWQEMFTQNFSADIKDENSGPDIKWFFDGKLNFSENCLEKNIGQNKTALIWESENPDEQNRKFTYEELLAEVNKFANALKKLGVKNGDTVGIYLPVIPEIVIAMLACTRIGAVHLVVFSAFSPEALQIRLQTVKTKILITADGYYRRGKIVELKNKAELGAENTQVEKMVVVRRASNQISWQEGKDLWFDKLIENESEVCQPEIMDSEDMLFVLPESGTTGQFLPITHTTAGYALQAKVTGQWVFDFKPTDILWSTADPGWITGHTYSIYSPLLNGITTVLFEGAPDFPTQDRWAKIIEKHKITIFYTAPTAIRMFKQYGAESFKNCDLSSLRLLGSVGEPIDESAWIWYAKEIGKNKCPVVDTFWQTETGAIITTSLPGIGPFKPAFTGLALPGINLQIVDDNGKPCKINEEGNLVMTNPYCPAILRGIFGSPEKYKEVYWNQFGPDVYTTSDRAIKEKHGLIRITGRADDVIKIAGHRITTGELESAINEHAEIDESAVIGVPDQIKGFAPVVFATYKGAKNKEDVAKEIKDLIRKKIGPLADPKQLFLVNDLPKTRSGKIMRLLLKKIYLAQELGELSSLANPESLEEIKTKLARQ